MEGNWQYRISQKGFAPIRSFEKTCLVSLGHAGDSVIAEYKLQNPEAYDREDTNGAVPSSAVLSRVAHFRLEPDSSEGSSPNEGAQERLGVDRTWKAALGGIKLHGT